MAIPRWLRWLASPDPLPASRLDVLDGVDATDDAEAEFLSVWREAMSGITEAIDTVRLREFVAALPSTDRPLPPWQWSYDLTPREVLERAFPKSYRKERR